MRVGQPTVSRTTVSTKPAIFLVTGAAGFIGSHLCERLVRDGHRVRGIDSFVPYYPRSTKEQNLAWLRSQPNFEFSSIDLRSDALDERITSVDAIFHLAAMPGLPLSWTDFPLYESCNLAATHRLLQAALEQPRIPSSFTLQHRRFTDGKRPATSRSRAGPSHRMASRNWQPKIWAGHSPRSTVFHLSRFAISPCTVRGNAPTWAITASSRL